MFYESTIITGRKYPDGEAIPDPLPSLYRPSDRCENCSAYVASKGYCLTWGADVRPEYVCAVWKPIELS